jgi:drug/metabolite transporter (DMT)-like permease
MILGLSAALGAAAVFGFAAIIQARAVRRLDRSEPDATATAGRSIRFLLHLLRQPLFLLAVALNLAGFVLHLVAIRTIPLYLAQAGIAGSLAVTAILAVLLMRERLTRADWSAVTAITVGLVVLAIASGDIGDGEPPTGFATTLFIGIAVVAVLGLALTRSRSSYAASCLGLLAGLGFAGSGLSARVLPGLMPANLWDSPATYALPISGGLAFALYSFALRRGSVTEATGPMIVMQTVTPALVGVAVLGDQVRDGWGIVAVVGFVLTGAGAIALARFEGGPVEAGR